MSAEAERLKILYIASSGRSGSTVLDLLLGAHPGCWTLGEFFVLPWEIRTPTKPCGCGKPVEQCPFWGPIVADQRPLLLGGSIDRFRESYWTDHLLHYRELGFLWSPSARRLRAKQDLLDRFGRDNHTVLSSVLSAARAHKGQQVRWLVDASKSVYRLLYLRDSGRFDLRAVHLVKDPRAFVHSYSKGSTGWRRLRNHFKGTLRWNVENRLFDRLFRMHFAEGEVLRLRYEELASDPHASLGRIMSWLGLEYDPALPAKFRGENHGISGNPARFDTSEIRLDEQWKTALARATQRTIRVASRGLVRRYGIS